MNTCRRADAESHLKLEGLDPRDIIDEQFFVLFTFLYEAFCFSSVVWVRR
jgi:hypothetical protein